MRRCWAMIGVAFCLVSLMPAEASAGGWWSGIDLTRRYLAVGQRFGVSSELGFLTKDGSRRAASGEDRFYAYLLEDFDRERLRRAMGKADPGDWLEVTAPIHLLGAVEFADRDANLLAARMAFTTPNVVPGRYDLMLCDATCEAPLGNVVPTTVGITDDHVAALGAARSDRLSRRLRGRVDSLQGQINRLRKQVVIARSRIDAQEPVAETDNMHELAPSTVDTSGKTQGSPPLLFAFGALVAAGSFVLGRKTS